MLKNMGFLLEEKFVVFKNMKKHPILQKIIIIAFNQIFDFNRITKMYLSGVNSGGIYKTKPWNAGILTARLGAIKNV